MKTGTVSESTDTSRRMDSLPRMVTVIMIDKDYFDDFVVAKDIRIGVDAIDTRIGRLLPSRKSCVQGRNFLWNVAVVVYDRTLSPLAI